MHDRKIRPTLKMNERYPSKKRREYIYDIHSDNRSIDVFSKNIRGKARDPDYDLIIYLRIRFKFY